MSERQFAMNPGDNAWFSIKTILVVNVWVSIMLYVCAVNGHKLYIYTVSMSDRDYWGLVLGFFSELHS